MNTYLTQLITALLVIFSIKGNIENGSYQFKTVKEFKPAEGITYTQISESTQPWSIHVVRVDLTSPDISIISKTAFDSIGGLQSVKEMAAHFSRSGYKVIAAVNADFFEDGGNATNAQVCNGQLVKMPGYFSSIGFSATDSIKISRIKFYGLVKASTTSAYINGVNKDRAKDEMILYNHFEGHSTHTNSWGNEIAVQAIDPWYINDTVRVIAGQLLRHHGNISIPDGQAVLSGHDISAQWLSENVHSGDTLKVFIGLQGMPKKIRELVGGFTHLVTTGKNSAIMSFDSEGKPQIRDKFALARHPRTAIGINKSGKILFLVTVDGRQNHSSGMSLPELADYMISLDAYEALNFDGGGSTTMVVNGKVVNSPSDPTGDRSVGNALLVLSRVK